MSKKLYSLLAGAFTLCAFNHRLQGCPICIDSLGTIKKPFFCSDDKALLVKKEHTGAQYKGVLSLLKSKEIV